MCRSAHILRVTVHIPANTTAGTYAQSLSNFYPGGTSRTTKVHEVRVSIMDAWHTSPQTPPTAGPPLAPMTNIFFRRQDRNSGKAATARSRRHKRFTVAGASRPRASTPGSRSAASGQRGNPDNAPAHGHDDARFYDRQQDYGHARGR